MATESVRVDWLGEKVFLLRDHYDFPLVMTQPMGVCAADLLPLSLIGCSVWDVASILQKQRMSIEEINVTAHSERDSQPPWAFRKIHLVYTFTGYDLDERSIRRAIELTETKYCAIHATLRNAVELTSSYEIVEMAGKE